MTLFLEDPVLEIALIAGAIVLFTFIVRKIMTDQSKQDKMKLKQKTINKEYQEAMKSGDEKRIKAAEAQYKELMGLIKDNLKDNFKPLYVTMIPVLIIFWVLKDAYDGTGVIMTLPLVGWELSWFWWYLIVAIVCSLIFEKIYDVIRVNLLTKKQ